MDSMCTSFVVSLLGLDKAGADVAFIKNSLVYDARNQLAIKAIDEDYDRVLWLDSDMRFDADLLTRLSADMDAGIDFVCGIFFKRATPLHPCIYKAIYVTKEDGKSVPHADEYEDYPRDSLFHIAGSGFAATMTSVDLLRRVREKYGLPFSPRIGFGEDFSFCMRAAELGVQMYCDSSIKVGHIGYAEFTEESYKGRE